jgi:hypothetical protein
VRVVPVRALRARPVTTSMWHRGGQESPEYNLHGSVATAAIMRRCFNSAGYRVHLPPAFPAVQGKSAHDDVIGDDGARNAGRMSPRRRM